MKMCRENFGFNNFNKKKILVTFSIYIFFFVFFLSVGFAAFQESLVVDDISAEVRLAMDVRVSKFNVNSLNNNAVASNTDYNYNRIYGDILLPETDSYVIYEMSITNIGNTKAGIYNMSNLNPNLKFTLLDYDLGDPLCVDGSYTLGITQKILVKIEYADGVTPSANEHPFNIELEFREFYSVTYHGVPGEENHPAEVMEGTDLVITTELTSIERMKITQDTVFLVYGEHYTYNSTSKQLTVKNVTGDLLLSYRDIVYLASLSSSSAYFKEYAYKDNITKIEFVNYIDITNAVKTYDLSENGDNSIIGWVIDNGDGTYNLFIGSVYDIYTKNLYNAFAYMYGLRTINFQNLNTSESTSFSYTFFRTKVTNLDLSTFNTSSATEMINMFAEMSNLQTLDVSNFNTSKVTNMWNMFGGLSNITELDISTFNTSNVENMGHMFSGMSKLKTLNLGKNFKTSKVTTMSNMFADLYSLESLDLSTFDTTSLTAVDRMFYNCVTLKTLDVSSLKMSNVTNMSYMFSGMTGLTSLDLSSFDTSKCTTMESMFSNCNNLTTLNVSSFNTSNVKNMKNMFMYVSSIKKLDLSSFDTSLVTNMDYFASYCYELTELDMRQATFTSIIFSTSVFYRIPSTVTVIAKDEESKTWLQTQLGTGTVVIYTPPAEEGTSTEGETTI